MLKTLHSETVPVKVRADDGTESTADVLKSVTFTDFAGAAHTLTFHPEGTDVSGEAEDVPRVVGEDVKHFHYTDPDDAIADYMSGKVA
jgi:hypothetical protein